MAALPWAQRAVAGFLCDQRQAERLVGRAELLVEELIANVIHHGGITDPAARLGLTIELEARGGCRLIFEDPGRAFDPVAAALPPRPARVEDARIGGLGLVLLQRMARDLAYERLPEGRNRLSFRLDPAG